MSLARSLQAFAGVAAAGAFDVIFGEPPDSLHLVAWLGRGVAVLQRLLPRGDRSRDLASGAAIVAATAVVGTVLGRGASATVQRAPAALRPLLMGVTLTPTFALRGLLQAGAAVAEALGRDTDQARSSLRALVSRDHRKLDPPQIVSAAVESLAENLTDSVVARSSGSWWRACPAPMSTAASTRSTR